MSESGLYWIASTISALPALLWVYLAVGLPWTLALLPRRDWHDGPLVAALTLALGPALLTAWMFVLGTVGGGSKTPLLRFDLIFAGTLALGAVGGILAWRGRKSRPEGETGQGHPPLSALEKLLLVLIGAALILRWLTTSYWPFTAYDPIWVYGYEGRLYTLLGYIPQEIGYYPQFLPLQYTYAQLAYGTVNDHAARAVLPFLHVGAILAVYSLGRRLFTRRVGIIAAALWALYPHVGQWAHVGDLEIPQTFTFTLAALFFLQAWSGDQPRFRYALLAGLTYSIALWTKPTAGALVWGVLLVILVDLFAARFNWRAWLPRFRAAVVMGIATIPLGGLWYVRNVLLGHAPIDLPNPFWLEQAQRSGTEFGWPLLALLLLLAYLYLGPRGRRPSRLGGIIGLVLVLLGLFPSILDPHRMMLAEWAALTGGLGIVALTLLRHMRGRWDTEAVTVVKKLGLAWLLALPYFVTWFYSYSYHYRLSFAIVPLLLLPSAVVLAQWSAPEVLSRLHRIGRLALYVLAALISLPGILVTLHDYGGGWDWLWTDKYPNDYFRYASENPSLMITVGALNDYVRETGQQPIIAAPGVQLLSFFFPLAQIDNHALPDRLSQLDGFTHFVYSRHGVWAYEEAGIAPEENQIVAALERPEIFFRRAAHDDGNFFYELYDANTSQRFDMPEISFVLEDEVIVGGFARYVGANLHFNQFHGDTNQILLEIFWKVLEPIPEDYMLFVRLISADDDEQKAWAVWDGPVAEGPHGYYRTALWEPGEYILYTRYLRLQDAATPPGNNYRVIAGMYDRRTQERLPVTVNGQPGGDSFDIGGISLMVR